MITKEEAMQLAFSVGAYRDPHYGDMLNIDVDDTHTLVIAAYNKALEDAVSKCMESADMEVNSVRMKLSTERGKAIFQAMSAGALNCARAIESLKELP